ncbi:ABC transporter ATP-binding protein [Kurthia sibirica]|uniref:ABC transporter domain-containing protein n=1 Tax=Kurthia sibirica TaxID=202750 RepID=A0A2U3ALF0_9BACL|nr:ATP-binding cassette domain-containing protein [Kurthia sibirica]PWI25344.1 hypothetical protein DEX24_08360 [Kurthia sibirica]GEK34410.1 putative ABC transporter ATP-binding protein [Kurthia sibirica]
MVLLQIKNVSFTLPTEERILKRIDLTIEEGEFHVVFGPSGSGKTTLLKMFSQQLRPFGNFEGEIEINGVNMMDLNEEQLVRTIRFVHQNPNDQIIFEDVLQELAFGLENLGIPSDEIQNRMAEMVHFLKIESWLHEKTAYLSGGQKQILNLASALIMRPDILLLDEPTAQLDPLAATDFIHLLKRVNDELGTTIILIEHRVQALFPLATSMTFLEGGEVRFSCPTNKILEYLSGHENMVRQVLPPGLLLSHDLGLEDAPFTVKESIQLLKKYHISQLPFIKDLPSTYTTEVLKLKNISFRYDRKGRDVLKNIHFSIAENEIMTIFGNNGSGKTTLLKIITGQKNPYAGELFIDGVKQKKLKSLYASRKSIGYLPQNPLALFIEKTVLKDFEKYCRRLEIDPVKIDEVVAKLNIENYLHKHPEDLSGGEIQRVALAKLLLNNPKILLLDEPTKGLDLFSKNQMADLLLQLKQQSCAILIVTHDLEFAVKVATSVALFFDGKVLEKQSPRIFFSNNHYYTPAISRIVRPFDSNIINYEELLQSTKNLIGEFK